MIGIRQADGSFYEIMDDADSGHKRLVLSAARADQHGVRIELFRSEDGALDPAGALGTITLDDSEGLGYQDIEFRVDLREDGQLDASAALPGQPPQTLSVDLTPFRGVRNDNQILEDDTLDLGELDTLDDSFSSDPEPMTLDLPDDLPQDELEPPKRSDADILADDSLDGSDLDTLDDFNFGDQELEAPEFEAEKPAPSRSTAQAPDSFDLDDLDAGFEDEPLGEMPAAPADDWEKISLDDMESMEFMDTGDEISAPTPSDPKKKSAAPASLDDLEPLSDDFSFDDSPPLKLAEFDSDLDDGPSLDDDLDHDFLAPPELTETPLWDEDPEPVPLGKPAKAAKTPKAEKTPKAARQTTESDEPVSSGGLDKTALLLSLATLSLLVLLILVLLFLNMVKAPPAPMIQPEVSRWKPVATMDLPSESSTAAQVNLGDASAPPFLANSVLEVPFALRSAEVSLVLEPGDTASDAERRFGRPALDQGKLLFW